MDIHDAPMLESASEGSARERRIAEAAYYRAEKRGFASGFALEDWLAAENLIAHEDRHALDKR